MKFLDRKCLDFQNFNDLLFYVGIGRIFNWARLVFRWIHADGTLGHASVPLRWIGFRFARLHCRADYVIQKQA
jgi:hypothetical protein